MALTPASSGVTVGAGDSSATQEAIQTDDITTLLHRHHSSCFDRNFRQCCQPRDAVVSRPPSFNLLFSSMHCGSVCLGKVSYS